MDLHITSLPRYTFSYEARPVFSFFQAILPSQWSHLNLLVPSLAIMIFLTEVKVSDLLFLAKCILKKLQKEMTNLSCHFPQGDSLVD